MRHPGPLIVLFGLLLLGACSPAPDEAAQSPTTEAGAPAAVEGVTADVLLARMEAGDAPFVLDVRTPDEFAAGHIPGAVNIPHTEIDARMAELGDDPDREVVVHCKSGRRADMAEQQLLAAGFTRVLHLEGDMDEWVATGRPVVVPSAR